MLEWFTPWNSAIDAGIKSLAYIDVGDPYIAVCDTDGVFYLCDWIDKKHTNRNYKKAKTFDTEEELEVYYRLLSEWKINL